MTVGRVLVPHGIRGEVKVEPLTDFPERFDAGGRVWIEGAARLIERSRPQDRNLILKLQGVDTRDAAEALRGKELMLPEAPPIDEPGRFYQHDILGLRVEDAAGEKLGVIADILSTGANDVYVVRGERGELLLPAVEDVVKQIDLTSGSIIVELLPGLKFRASTPKRRRPPAKPPAKKSTPAPS
ncbi:MAG: 16S rRNA processing protein RimM [Dehalococcoidia bacterium]|nr:16S rRNA processing protein RimM [Dehalococcoidia bacterium]